MSIADEITRLQTAKANIKTAIIDKGGTIDDETIDQYATVLDNLLSGGLTIEGQQTITGILTGAVDEFDTVYSEIIGDATLISPAHNTIPLGYHDLGYALESGEQDDEIEMISIFR